MHKISDFVPGDISNILSLEEELFNPPYTADQLLQDSDSSITLIKIGDEVVAYLYAHRSLDEIEIYHIGVRKRYQRNGLATTLLSDLLEKYSRSHDILLEVKEDNESARKLYDKMGFMTYHIRKAYYQDGKDALLMRMKRR